jgi:lysophospholipase L1-like esterase
MALVLSALSCRPSNSIRSEVPDSALAPREAEADAIVPASTASAAPAPAAPMTSCREVLHVGDSTSVGLVSNQFLPNVDDQIAARYRAVGVERFLPEISGGRSLVELYGDQPNATQVVRRRMASGYAGCIVLALGTNDSANTGGNVAALGTRTDAMMSFIGADLPVLWITTKTLKDRGPYQSANMQSWTRALTEACPRHPRMRVYDWASEVHDDWFATDAIHYNSAGYRERAARIARALARAFPKDGSPSAGCLVGSE